VKPAEIPPLVFGTFRVFGLRREGRQKKVAAIPPSSAFIGHSGRALTANWAAGPEKQLPLDRSFRALHDK
jgi:hypothetical protein